MLITKTIFIAGAMLLASTTSKPEQFSQNYAVNVEMWWRNLPFVDRIHAAADAGFTTIEFWPWRGKNIDEIAKLGAILPNITKIYSATLWLIMIAGVKSHPPNGKLCLYFR